MKLFIKDQTPYIVLHVMQFGVLYVTFRWLDRTMIHGNLAYLFVVSLCLLALYLVYRYLLEHMSYTLLSQSSTWDDATAFLRMDTPSPLLRAVKDGLARQYQLLQHEREQSIQEKQVQIDGMNQFVHVLKTPLSALRLIVLDHEDMEGAEEMQAEIDRMDYHLNMILTLSRVSAFHQDFFIQPVHVAPLVSEVINELKSHFIRHHVFPAAAVPNDVHVLSDRKWLKFVLLQLLTNAIRYSAGEHRRITVTVQQQHDATLSVQDEGVGIPPQDLPRVFDLYYTGSNGRSFGESTGIGLFLVRTICDELDHKVSIHSILGKGTEVTLHFAAPVQPTQAKVTAM